MISRAPNVEQLKIGLMNCSHIAGVCPRQWLQTRPARSTPPPLHLDPSVSSPCAIGHRLRSSPASVLPVAADGRAASLGRPDGYTALEHPATCNGCARSGFNQKAGAFGGFQPWHGWAKTMAILSRVAGEGLGVRRRTPER